MKSTTSIVKETAALFRLAPDQWGRLPGAVQQLMNMAMQSRFILTLEIDVPSAQIRSMIASALPGGGTSDEFTQLSKVATQVAQYFQQRALDMVKQEVANGKAASANGQVGQPDNRSPEPESKSS